MVDGKWGDPINGTLGNYVDAWRGIAKSVDVVPCFTPGYGEPYNLRQMAVYSDHGVFKVKT
jgi:hypothetical protein